jgi:hypothetical protein
MKRIILTFAILIFFSQIAKPQSAIFSENFENTNLKVTSSSVKNNNTWAISTLLKTDGVKSIRAVPALADTTYLTTDSFSTIGLTYIRLEFNHIAKMEFYDFGIIEISTDNGLNWQRLDDSLYLGNGFYGAIGNAFNSVTYTDWLISNNSAIPDSSWWKAESFNLSKIAENKNYVKIRFALVDGNSSGSAGNFGWIIDEIKVIGNYSELFPPAITLLNPFPTDTIYQNTSQIIKCLISDSASGGSGIDSAILIYRVGVGINNILQLTHLQGDTFSAQIPFPGFGRKISYYIKAWDGSPAHNSDTTVVKSFFTYYSPGGSYTFGTGTNSSYYFGPIYRSSNYSIDDYSRYSYLLPATEMNNAGVPKGYPISKIEWYKTTSHATNGGAMFKIFLKNSDESQLIDGTSWPIVINGATEVLNTNNQHIPNTVGWIEFPINPFIYSGSGIEITTDWDITSGSNPPTSGAFEWRYSSNLPNTYTIGQGNMIQPSNLMGTIYGGNIRPNIRISFVNSGLLHDDMGINAIISGNSAVMANQNINLVVNVKNHGNDTINAGQIQWSIDGVSQSIVPITASISPNSISQNYQIGILNLNSGTHNLKIWTSFPNGVEDFNYQNDTLSQQIIVCSGVLSGSYTIGGTSPDYQTLGQAVAAITNCGISGNVTFNIAPGNYSERLDISEIIGSSATNRVVFQSANGDSNSVVISLTASNGGNNYIIKLTNTEYITFKKLSFVALDTNFSRIIDFRQNSNNIIFENNIIKVSNHAYGNNDNRNLVQNSVGSIQNILFNNNKFINGSIAIKIESAGNQNDSIEIINNLFENNAYSAIVLSKIGSPIISKNKISNLLQTDDYQAIYLDSCIGKAIVSNNEILTTNSKIAYGIGIQNSKFDSLNPAMIFNNFVRLSLNSASSTISSGILNYQTQNAKYVFNTIHLTGNQPNSAALSLFDNTPISSNISILNNIITNQSSGYLTLVYGVDTSKFVSDYNIFYNYSGPKFFYIANNLINYSGWKTTTSGDSHSDTLNPLFASTTNLHIANSLINATAIPINGVLDDIDGETRNATTPDIGADEFDPTAYDIACLKIVTPESACGLGTSEQVKIRIKNVGSTAISSLTLGYKLNANNPIIESLSGTINPGDTLDYTFSTTANFSAAGNLADLDFALKAWTSYSADFAKQNDTTSTIVSSGFMPPPPTFSNVSINYGQVANLSATSPYNIHWWNSPTSATELAVGSSYTTPNLYDTIIFYLNAKVGTGLDTIQIGTGTAIDQYLPIEPYYGYSYSQSIYKPSYFNGKKGWISTIWYNSKSTSGYGPDAVKIYMGITTKNVFNHDSDWVNGNNLTMVYDGNMNISAGSGWVKFELSSPFYYSGVGNLVVAFDENTPGYHGANDDFYCTQYGTTNNSLYYFDDDINISHINTEPGYTSNYIPNIKLEMNDIGCFGNRVPLTVTVTGIPSVDAGILSIVSPSGSMPSGVPTPVKVVLKNYGVSNISSVKIIWSLNNVNIDTIQWTGNLTSLSTDTITLNSGYSFNGGVFTLAARTMLPNNIADITTSNDAATAIFTSCLSGTYTIGDTINGNADYGSINGALAAINTAGICGNVIFNISSGTYNEQVTIQDFYYLNANNSITFAGVQNDSTAVKLQFAATTSTASNTLVVSNSKHIKFQNIHIKAIGTSYGGVVKIINQSEFISFENCIIETAVSTSANFYNFNIDNSSRNRIKNCNIKNGHTAFQMYSLSTNIAKGNIIENNTINGFYSYAMYIQFQDSLIIKSNKIQSATNAVGYGLRLQNLGSSVKIINNNIILSPTSNLTAIYNNNSTATSANRGLIANNFIIINSGSGSYNYGIYAFNSTNYDYYHNSINITSGGTSSKGLYISQGNPSQNINIMNNIVKINDGYAVYASSADGVTNFDYNSYYSNATNKFYFGANRTTFAAYQQANPKESHSIYHNPDFVSNTNLHLTNTYLRSFGLPIPTVNYDIDNNLRSAFMVAIGADEPPLYSYDLGVVEILNIPDTTFETYSYPIQVVITNFGLNNLTTYNVSYNINNGTPVVQAITSPIQSFQTDTVTLLAFISGTGSYTICAKTVLANDNNSFNDENCETHFGISVKDASITRMVDLNQYCGMTYDTVKVWLKNYGLDTINGMGQQPTSISYQSNNLPIKTETFTNQLAPGDSALFQFANLVYIGTNNFTDSIYQIRTWINYLGDSAPNNDTAYKTILAIHKPATPVSNSPISIPYGTSTLLQATSPSNDTLFWYDQISGGNKIAAGPLYQTPTLLQSDTFYVQAGLGFSKQTDNLPTLYSGINSYLGAMFDLQAINEITIDSLYINSQASDTVEVWYRQGSYVGYNLTNAGWTLLGKYAVISAGSGNATRLPVGGLTIPAGLTYGIYVTYKTGSNALNYSNGNGTNQSFQNGDIIFTAGHAGGYFNATGTPRVFNGTIFYHKNVFGTSSCLSNPAEVIVNVGQQPSCDLGAISITNPDSSAYFTNNELVTVEVYNYGSQSQTNFPISYQIDNGTIITENFNLVCFPFTSTSFTFATKADLSANNPNYTIKAFTHISCDTIKQNDTITTVIAHKNYCISKSNNPDYEDITKVAIGSWSHSSNPTGNMYSDYTNLTNPAILQIGFLYPIEISTSPVAPNSYPYPGWVNMFIDFNQDGDFNDPLELVFSNNTTANNTVSATFIVPFSATPGITKMRVVFREYGTYSNTGPCGIYDYGETEDYYVQFLPWIPNDAGIMEIASPLKQTTELTQPLIVRVANYGSDTIHNLDIKYQLNNNPVQTYALNSTIYPLGAVYVNVGNITLNQGNNQIQAYTILANDTNTVNDSLIKFIEAKSYKSIPFFDDFDGSDYWMADSNSITWQLGKPSATIIDSAYSPQNAWVTRLDSTYSPNLYDYLYSPQFNVVSGTDSLILSFYHRFHTEPNFDGGYIQISIDSGLTWFTLGYQGIANSTNWYNSVLNGVHKWSGNSNGWINSKITIDYNSISAGGNGNIMFRFVFGSNSTNSNYEGWAIDNFELKYPQTNIDGGILSITNPQNITQTGSIEKVKVVIKNYGLLALTQIPAQYSVDGGSWISETFTPSQPLAPNDTITVEFATSFISPATDYILCAKTNILNDPFSFNNQSCVNIATTPAMIDGGIKTILEPIDTTIFAQNTYPKIVVKNYGINNITQAVISYKINNSTWIDENWTGQLAQNDTLIYTFTNPYSSPLNIYHLECKIKIINDQYAGNDIIGQIFIGKHVGIKENTNDFIVYQNIPNPADDYTLIPIHIKGQGEIDLIITNSVGMLIETYKLSNLHNDKYVKINTSNLPNGIYYYTIKYLGNSITKKMVINR